MPLGIVLGSKKWVASPALTVGRDRNQCDIVVRGLGVSRTHAKFLACDDKLLVMDLGSTNGTYLNGIKLPGVPPNASPRRLAKDYAIDTLRDGDRVSVSPDVTFVICAMPDKSKTDGNRPSTPRSITNQGLPDMRSSLNNTNAGSRLSPSRGTWSRIQRDPSPDRSGGGVERDENRHSSSPARQSQFDRLASPVSPRRDAVATVRARLLSKRSGAGVGGGVGVGVGKSRVMACQRSSVRSRSAEPRRLENDSKQRPSLTSRPSSAYASCPNALLVGLMDTLGDELKQSFPALGKIVSEDKNDPTQALKYLSSTERVARILAVVSSLKDRANRPNNSLIQWADKYRQVHDKLVQVVESILPNLKLKKGDLTLGSGDLSLSSSDMNSCSSIPVMFQAEKLVGNLCVAEAALLAADEKESVCEKKWASLTAELAAAKEEVKILRLGLVDAKSNMYVVTSPKHLLASANAGGSSLALGGNGLAGGFGSLSSTSSSSAGAIDYVLLQAKYAGLLEKCGRLERLCSLSDSQDKLAMAECCDFSRKVTDMHKSLLEAVSCIDRSKSNSEESTRDARDSTENTHSGNTHEHNAFNDDFPDSVRFEIPANLSRSFESSRGSFENSRGSRPPLRKRSKTRTAHTQHKRLQVSTINSCSATPLIHASHPEETSAEKFSDTPHGDGVPTRQNMNIELAGFPQRAPSICTSRNDDDATFIDVLINDDSMQCFSED